MAPRPWHLLSLCDGYGGTELALRSVARVRTVCRVERDSYAAAILVERMGETRLDQCPIWDDVATFNGRAWRGRVDIVAAGFPCPDFSSAGRRAGVDGVHWLWPECFEVIRQVGPSVVLLENVPGLVRLGGLTRVLSDLADDGFDAEWGLLAAAAVGAPHERERWWLVAHRDGGGLRPGAADDGARRGQPDPDWQHTHVGHANGARRATHTSSSSSSQGTDGWRSTNGDHVADGAVEDVGHPACVDEREPHHEARTVARCGSRPDVGGRCVGVADTESDGRQDDISRRCSSQSGGVESDPADVGQRVPCGRRNGDHHWPPGRDDHDGWAAWIAAGGPQPVLRRLTDGPPLGLADALNDRSPSTSESGPPNGLADALHLGGNGLVPQCAAHAWRQLLQRGGWSL